MRLEFSKKDIRVLDVDGTGFARLRIEKNGQLMSFERAFSDVDTQIAKDDDSETTEDTEQIFFVRLEYGDLNLVLPDEGWVDTLKELKHWTDSWCTDCYEALKRCNCNKQPETSYRIYPRSN